MPRIARVVASGYPHHVTQRGNYRQTVFETEDDYLLYLKWLREYSKQYDIEIWAYCLMNNHVHFVCVPGKEDSLARTFNTLHMRYAQHINKRRKSNGHLWQGRFYSAILDEAHVYAAVRYVENNPLRAGIVKTAEDYKWSSAKEHIDGLQEGIVSGKCYLLAEISNWKSYLLEKENIAMIERIKKCSMTGRPCGNESFIGKLEEKFARQLNALPHGRPRKKEK